MARSLTKRKADGTPYVRRPGVEACIDEVIGLPLEALKERLRCSPSAPGYLPSEVLVHLVRDAMRRDDVPKTNTLVTALSRRCEVNLKVHIADSVPGAPELREDIIGAFAELLASDTDDPDSDELDVYEVAFNRAFHALRVDTWRRERKHVRQHDPLPADISVGGDENDDDAPVSKLPEAFTVHPNDVEPEQAMRLAALVDALPEEQRTVLVLHYWVGLKQESQDKKEETVATRCKVSGRTVRTRIKDALTTLKTQLTEET
jgi:DNA-directed RNA polymerase specialized sigma24 family protein